MIFRFIIFALLITTSFAVHAQVFSDNNLFTVPEDKACAPYVPVVTAVDCISGGCTFFPDANDPTLARQLVSGQPIPDFEYQPGTWQMKVVIGNDPATQKIDFLTINIYDATAPDFNFFICTSNRIQLEITDTKYPEYSIDYNSDNTIDDTSPSGMVLPPFQYALGQAGIPQSIEVRGNYTNCLSTTKVATPGNFAPATPVINQLQVLNPNDLELALTTTDNYYYELEMSTNSPSAMLLRQKVTNENTLSINGLATENNYYCFRLGVADICSSPSLTYSNLICSADLDLTVQNDVMNLIWATSNSGVNNFSLNKTPGGPIILPSTSFNHNDVDIICGTEYSYQLINDYSNNIRSISLLYTGTAISNRIPTPVENTTSVVNGNSVELTWLQDPQFIPESYSIYRFVNNSTSSSKIGSTITPSFSDPNYVSEDHICYQIQYTDICGKQSDKSDMICPIELTGTLLDDNAVDLSWPPYNGWAIGVSHYVVEKYDQSGALYESVDNGLSPAYTDTKASTDTEQIFTYRILAVAADGTLLPLPSISNIITIIKSPNLSHPTAFVPNSQIDANTTFRVFGNYINTYELRIFNRWGELLFESFDKEQGWDGTYNGQRMPEGTYVFVAKITDFAGRKFEYGGTVVLLKKS